MLANLSRPRGQERKRCKLWCASRKAHQFPQLVYMSCGVADSSLLRNLRWTVIHVKPSSSYKILVFFGGYGPFPAIRKRTPPKNPGMLGMNGQVDRPFTHSWEYSCCPILQTKRIGLEAAIFRTLFTRSHMSKSSTAKGVYARQLTKTWPLQQSSHGLVS